MSFNRTEWITATVWVLFVFLSAAVNATSELSDFVRRGIEVETWQPWTWELSSAVSLIALTPALVLACRALPVLKPHLVRNAAAHVLLTVPFSVLHVVMMVGLREAAYGVAGQDYEFGDWPRELLYEYRKDLLTYCLVVAGIHVLLYRRRMAAPAAQSTEPFLSRLLVQHNFREQIVPVEKVQWVEADGNYVKLHTEQGVFRPRMTLSSLESRLDPNQFVRIHRSHLVSLGAVKEVQPWFHGDYRVLLESGETLPLSRRFRDRIKSR